MKTKLLENIKAVNTGKKEYISSPSTYIQSTYEPVDLATLTPEMGSVYRIDVSLGAVQVISDEALRENPRIVEHYKDAVARSVAEEVYGEIRKELMDTLIEMRRPGGLYYDNPVVKRIEKLIEKISY